MVTYFNRKDLVDFGKHLLSEERTNRIKALCEDGGISDVDERLREVYHNEVENWIYERSKNK